MRVELLNRDYQLQALWQQLRNATPAERISRYAGNLQTMEIRLVNAARRHLQAARTRFSIVTGELNAVSPLATLERGYAIVQSAKTTTVLRDATAVKAGDRIKARLAKGQIDAIVESVTDKTEDRSKKP